MPSYEIVLKAYFQTVLGKPIWGSVLLWVTEHLQKIGELSEYEASLCKISWESGSGRGRGEPERGEGFLT